MSQLQTAEPATLHVTCTDMVSGLESEFCHTQLKTQASCPRGHKTAKGRELKYLNNESD